ncbi:winged helix DNA-binding domain-containing protein [Streptomyces sp. YC504]|uniref:Winged helix DNA-binding domain-containing protein n=1 Tax=Streptomyces mesophilus TaxID=1775132 RepID=A0A6G4XDZ6_9ACTN|nr:winged helix DNA-binding domain-containing protein [Streptomyces mesophilus]NGO75057.1 winged helix DNA-binding domain-containing protein [Streptomyces mesophilus]
MTLSPRRLALATLDRQLLLERRPIDVTDAVRRLCALQAQTPASPYLALWNRVADLAPEHLDAAFADGRIVKASLMRITLHAVHAEDYPAFHAAMLSCLRAARLYDRRFTDTGLSAEDADTLLADLTPYLRASRTGAEAEAEVVARLGAGTERAWWALRTYAPLHHVPSGGPWSFGHRNTFRAAPPAPEVTAAQGAQQLLLSYLRAFGPATAQDFARFTLLPSATVKHAVEALRDTLRPVGGTGRAVLYDLPGATVPDEDVPVPPRLLPMWDSSLLAHAVPGRFMPAEFRPAAVRRNGDVLPCLLVDGQVAGVWRSLDGGGLELTAFRKLTVGQWRGLTQEAERLVTWLADRDPEVYRRYGHWWDKGMPGVETRIVKG